MPPERPDFYGKTPTEIHQHFLDTRQKKQLDALSDYYLFSSKPLEGSKILPSEGFTQPLFDNKTDGSELSGNLGKALRDENIIALLFNNRPLGLDEEFSPIDEQEELPLNFSKEEALRRKSRSQGSRNAENSPEWLDRLTTMFYP